MNSSSTSSTRKGDKRIYLIILLIIILVIVFVASLAFGSVSISLRDIIKGTATSMPNAVLLRNVTQRA